MRAPVAIFHFAFFVRELLVEILYKLRDFHRDLTRNQLLQPQLLRFASPHQNPSLESPDLRKPGEKPGNSFSRKFQRQLCIETQPLPKLRSQRFFLCEAALSGPVRDTPPYRATPFQESERRVSHPFALFSCGIAQASLRYPFVGGFRTSIYCRRASHLHFACSQRGKRSEGRGHRTQVAMLRHRKPHRAQ